MTTKTKLNFHSVFRSEGDSLWLAQDADGKDVFACSDGTGPYDCDHGPYIIDTEMLRIEGLRIVPSNISGKIFGRLRYHHNKDGWCSVSTSLGCARELCRRIGVTKVSISADIKSRERGEETITIVGEFQ